jgi:hypothetical protein
LNPADGSSISLFSVPTSAVSALPQLLSAIEINALNLYLPSYNSSSRHPVSSLSELPTTARIESISVSPSNRQVIVKTIYQTCFVPQNPICFGTTQLILIDQADQNSTILLNLGTHDDQFLPSVYPDPEMRITEVQWTPDEQAIVAKISNRASVESAVVIVPIIGGAPFKIGEGLTWATAPSGGHGDRECKTIRSTSSRAANRKVEPGAAASERSAG